MGEQQRSVVSPMENEVEAGQKVKERIFYLLVRGSGNGWKIGRVNVGRFVPS